MKIKLVLTSSVISIIVLIGIILTTPSAFSLEQNGVIEMPFTENPPAIDGKWTTKDEWSDASKTTIGSGDNVMILLVKHDRDYLYIMGDMIRDFSESQSYFLLTFDTNSNGGNNPDPEDVNLWTGYKEIGIVYGRWAGLEKEYTFTNEKGESKPFAGWMGIGKVPGSTMASSLSATNDPFESVLPHKIFELKIPFSFLYKNDKYGLAIVYTGSTYRQTNPLPDNSIIWPETVQRTAPLFSIPDDYGIIMDSKNQVTIPPIPVISLSATSLSFGNEEISEKSSPKTITISNQGTSILKISNARASGEFSIQGLSTPLEIQPSQSASLNVVFVPITIGEKSGTITISSNDLSKPTMTINLTGKGIEKGNGGCLIATATYGSELAPQVQQLRELRDNSLLQTASGTVFMNSFNQFYYSFSPTIADWERENPVFKEMVKITLTPMISSLSILNYVDMDSEASAIGYGISLILLNVGIYFVAPTFIVMRVKSKVSK